MKRTYVVTALESTQAHEECNHVIKWAKDEPASWWPMPAGHHKPHPCPTAVPVRLADVVDHLFQYNQHQNGPLLLPYISVELVSDLIPQFVHAKAVGRVWYREEDLQIVTWLRYTCHSFVHLIFGHEGLTTMEQLHRREARGSG